VSAITAVYSKKCFFHCSNLVKFVVRYGVMSGRYRSTLGSNFHLCVSRFKFNQWAFFDGCVNADNVIRQHCFSLRFGVAQFMRDSITLRDTL